MTKEQQERVSKLDELFDEAKRALSDLDSALEDIHELFETPDVAVLLADGDAPEDPHAPAVIVVTDDSGKKRLEYRG